MRDLLEEEERFQNQKIDVAALGTKIGFAFLERKEDSCCFRREEKFVLLQEEEHLAASGRPEVKKALEEKEFGQRKC